MEKDKPNFDYIRWSRDALLSQDASNAMGLMHSAIACLRDWRDSGEAARLEDFNGRHCVPLRMMMFQIFHLTCREPDYPGDYSSDTEMMKVLGGFHEQRA